MDEEDYDSSDYNETYSDDLANYSGGIEDVLDPTTSED